MQGADQRFQLSITPTSSFSFKTLLSKKKKKDANEQGLMAVLADFYPWVKALHVIAVVAWMAGLFYLPRLYVYHVERAQVGSEVDALFQVMERRLLKAIMNPAMIVTWICGILLVMTPGIVDWSMVWPWTKAASVCLMTWFHMWLGIRRKDFVAGSNTVTGRTFRMMNEVPTLLLIIIVTSVIVKF